MKTFGSEFQSFRLRIIFGCIILLFLAIVCVIWKISAEYRASISSTQAQTNDQVLAIEVFMLNAIDRMNAPLNAVAAAISQRSTEVSFTPADVKSLLTSPLLPSTADYWFVFINAEGIAIAASNDLPVLGVSFSDREYYLAQKSKRREGLLIGDPNFGRASGIRIFSITRRVDDAQGNFMGIIVAVVDLIPLVKILGQFSKDNSQTITVASSSRKIIAQIPNFEESFSKDFSNSSLFTCL